MITSEESLPSHRRRHPAHRVRDRRRNHHTRRPRRPRASLVHRQGNSRTTTGTDFIYSRTSGPSSSRSSPQLRASRPSPHPKSAGCQVSSSPSLPSGSGERRPRHRLRRQRRSVGSTLQLAPTSRAWSFAGGEPSHSTRHLEPQSAPPAPASSATAARDPQQFRPNGERHDRVRDKTPAQDDRQDPTLRGPAWVSPVDELHTPTVDATLAAITSTTANDTVHSNVSCPAPPARGRVVTVDHGPPPTLIQLLVARVGALRFVNHASRRTRNGHPFRGE